MRNSRFLLFLSCLISSQTTTCSLTVGSSLGRNVKRTTFTRQNHVSLDHGSSSLIPPPPQQQGKHGVAETYNTKCFGSKFLRRSSSCNYFPSSMRRSTSSTALQMCICIDCARVTDCAAYHFVEEKHEQPHMTNDPTFTPQDGSPTIHVNVRTIRSEESKAEVARMWSEHKREQEIAEKKAAATTSASEEDNNMTDDDGGESSLFGEEIYDLSARTTYEYDVVKCADYVQDRGCWIRNMPEEIRVANPYFVPS